MHRVAAHPAGNRALAEIITGLDACYEPGEHPWLGRLAPDVPLRVGDHETHLAALLHSGRPVLVDLAGSFAAWSSAVEVVPASSPSTSDIGAVLLRPDGHVAWLTNRNGRRRPGGGDRPLDRRRAPFSAGFTRCGRRLSELRRSAGPSGPRQEHTADHLGGLLPNSKPEHPAERTTRLPGGGDPPSGRRRPPALPLGGVPESSLSARCDNPRKSRASPRAVHNRVTLWTAGSVPRAAPPGRPGSTCCAARTQLLHHPRRSHVGRFVHRHQQVREAGLEDVVAHRRRGFGRVAAAPG